MSAGSYPAVALAPHTTLTRLPFGGAVLVNGVSLAMLECVERDAFIVDRLLAHELPPGDLPPYVRRLAEQMVDAGWFVPVAASDRRR